jgi:hypothetical protein
LTNVDYIGKPSNISRLLEVAEKLEREPDILIVEMPPCRMVTSGLITGQTDSDDESRRFDEMWGRLGSRIAAVLANSWELSEWDRVYKGIKEWLARQEHLELDEGPGRHELFHYAGPHSAKMEEWNYGKIRYFVPIKTKGEKNV